MANDIQDPYSASTLILDVQEEMRVVALFSLETYIDDVYDPNTHIVNVYGDYSVSAEFERDRYVDVPCNAETSIINIDKDLSVHAIFEKIEVPELEEGIIAPVDPERMQSLGCCIKQMSQLDFTWNYQNIKEPECRFISGRLVSVSDNLMNDKSYIEENGQVEEVNKTIEEYMLYLSAKGTGANRVLKRLSSKFRLSPNRDKMLDSGFCFVKGGPVIDLTSLIGVDFNEQASLDIMLRTSMDVKADTYKMETINLT